MIGGVNAKRLVLLISCVFFYKMLPVCFAHLENDD